MEVVTPFKPTRSMTEASGKTKTFRNNAGKLVFHRMVAVDVENWNEKSFYGDLFLDETDKDFFKSTRGRYPYSWKFQFIPKQRDSGWTIIGVE